MDVSCASRIPEVRVVGDYPRRLSGATPATPRKGNQAGSAGLRLAAVGAAAVGDAIAQWWYLPGSRGHGLRGGWFTVEGDTSVRSTSTRSGSSPTPSSTAAPPGTPAPARSPPGSRSRARAASPPPSACAGTWPATPRHPHRPHRLGRPRLATLPPPDRSGAAGGTGWAGRADRRARRGLGWEGCGLPSTPAPPGYAPTGGPRQQADAGPDGSGPGAITPDGCSVVLWAAAVDGRTRDRAWRDPAGGLDPGAGGRGRADDPSAGRARPSGGGGGRVAGDAGLAWGRGLPGATAGRRPRPDWPRAEPTVQARIQEPRPGAAVRRRGAGLVPGQQPDDDLGAGSCGVPGPRGRRRLRARPAAPGGVVRRGGRGRAHQRRHHLPAARPRPARARPARPRSSTRSGSGCGPSGSRPGAWTTRRWRPSWPRPGWPSTPT